MKLDHLTTTTQLQDFLLGSQAIIFAVATTKDERYHFVWDILRRFNYTELARKDKGVVIQFLIKVSGYSRQQLTRMIKRYVDTKRLKRQQKTTNGFERRYAEEDIQLLIELDKQHNTPNGLMVKKLFERAFHVFKESQYKRLAYISVSHIYNLRKSASYKKRRYHFEKTKSKKKAAHIGQRRKPRANGQPGYLRIDTVHQGDLDGNKGVYHINAIDEVTQWEVVISVERISENHLIPALTLLLESFPFTVLNFHSGNGSEYINEKTYKLLNKMNI